MAYNDKRLKTDLEGKPIPQAYNPDIDDYEPVHSTNNALNQVIYGPNGQPISTVGNKLAVRATELEALMQGLATEGKLEQVRQLLSGVATENKLEQARALLEAISTKDFATQTTLAAVLAKLADLESELATIKANQLSGDQKVQLSGTIGSKQVIVRKINANFTHELGIETIYQTTKPVIIDQFTWVVSGSNAPNGFQIRIPLKGQFFNTIEVGKAAFEYNTPRSILNNIAPQWEVIIADAVNNVYAFNLRNTPLAFPEGITLEANYVRTDMGSFYYAAFVLGREML